ncbi:uncharacterized protein LOC132749488 [Ruditapes philippinarum]|uniref:uncharacterized protein LOC132749488 n=1 Tax=Ruditapes philippinarum TaxID=129788 RepID=UPI00295BF88B|nr:uncharacterized protein LOC132749488 [Ruditapes philippinarum]
MSKFEQFLCRNHSRIETRGKKGRKVAILLTKTMKANIDQLISLKNEETEYLFQLPGAKFPLRGADVLRRFTSEAALKHPKSVTSTSLRKQLATMSQVLNLDNNDQDILARFTGHDLNVHRDFDRLPQSTLEVAKVSKVLHALNIGSLDSIKGKNFDDIDAEGDLEYEPASDEDDDNIVEPTDGVVENDNSDREDVFSEYSDDSEADASCKKPIGKRRKISQKTPWSKEEQDIVFSEFKKCFTLNVLPKKLECEQLIKKHPVLTRRTWTMVKGFVRTRQLAMKRQKSCN